MPRSATLTTKQFNQYIREIGLLGKWREDSDFRQARGFILGQHVREALLGVDFLFSVPFHGYKLYPSFGSALYDMMDLGRFGVSFAQFRQWCHLAVLAHDMGKCGGEFQWMLWMLEYAFQMYFRAKFGRAPLARGVPEDPAAAKEIRKWKETLARYRQQYRHEFLSAVLLYHHPAIHDWFLREAGSEEGLAYIIAATFGHHLKADQRRALRSDKFLTYEPKPIFLRQMTDALRGVLSENMGGWDGDLTRQFPQVEDIPADNAWTGSIANMEGALDSIDCDAKYTNIRDNAVSGAIKWVVILADTLGSISALPQETAGVTRNRVRHPLQVLFQPGDVNYYARIINGLLHSTAPEGKQQAAWERKWQKALLLPQKKQKKLLERAAYGWQLEVGTDGNLIVTVATGRGKTFGSFWWAARAPHLNLLFCGTTTDAVTELRDAYGLESDFTKHHRSFLDELDRADLTPTPEDSPLEDFKERQEAEKTVGTFQGLVSEVTFATADAVLGVMSFYRSSVMWLPYLLKSQVVFDEVHSFDPVMRGWHRQFLDWFPKIRTAHLSATVPNSFLKDIQERTTRDGKAPLVVLSPREGEFTQKRFRLHLAPSMEDAAKHFANGTIWFTNTVGRCQTLGEQFSDAVLYHSRFGLQDKRDIRKRLMATLGKGGSYDCRILATQAAEISLNIDAFLGISELAPLEAILQRLGRINRFGRWGVVDVFFYMPDIEHGLPYIRSKDWASIYAEWAAWLKQFEGLEVSYADLEDAFQAYYTTHLTVQPKDVATSFLHTTRVPVRQAIVTVPILLPEVVANNPNMSWVEAMRLAVPAILSSEDKRSLRAAGRLVHRIFVVEEGFSRYDARLGLIQKSRAQGGQA